MKTKFLIVYLISFLAIISCEQFLEVELPGQDPKLVLSALLEPSDTLKVFLTESKGILEERDYLILYDFVEGAEVYLKDQNGQTFSLEYLERNIGDEKIAFYYYAENNLMEGEVYEIFAEKAGFLPISSKEKIPMEANIKSIDMINLGPDDNSEGSNLFEVTVKFDDPWGKNFYEISGEIRYRDSNFSDNLYLNPVNPIYRKDHMNYRNVVLFDDVLLNGLESEIVFRTNFPRDVDVEVTINFSHVSESYYLFYDTAYLQWYNRGDFLSQPVLVYNNITNGMGIFKSRNTVRRVIEMRVED